MCSWPAYRRCSLPVGEHRLALPAAAHAAAAGHLDRGRLFRDEFRELVSSAAAAAGSAAEAAPAVHTLSAIMPRPATLPFRNVLRENLVDMVRSSHSFCRNATIYLYSCFFCPAAAGLPCAPNCTRDETKCQSCFYLVAQSFAFLSFSPILAHCFAFCFKFSYVLYTTSRKNA